MIEYEIFIIAGVVTAIRFFVPYFMDWYLRSYAEHNIKGTELVTVRYRFLFAYDRKKGNVTTRFNFVYMIMFYIVTISGIALLVLGFATGSELVLIASFVILFFINTLCFLRVLIKILYISTPPQDEDYKELPQDEEWRNKATRKLIMKRKKTMVAAVSKIYVFLGDGQGEFVIKGIKCTEVGTLKNGDSGEYDIPTESVYIFVSYSKKYPEGYHSHYQVPCGNISVKLFIAPSLFKGKIEIFGEQDPITSDV